VIDLLVAADIKGPEIDYAGLSPLFALGGAVLLGGLVASTLEFLGWSVRRRIRVPALGVADGLLGAALMGAVGLGLAWIIGAVALQTPGGGGSVEEPVGGVRAGAPQVLH